MTIKHLLAAGICQQQSLYDCTTDQELTNIRLLKRSSAGETSFTKDLADNNLPKYAILSHTRGERSSKVMFWQG